MTTPYNKKQRLGEKGGAGSIAPHQSQQSHSNRELPDIRSRITIRSSMLKELNELNDDAGDAL